MKSAKRRIWLVAPAALVVSLALAGCGSSHHDHGDSTYYQPAGYRQEPQQQQRYNDYDRDEQHRDNDQHHDNNQHHDND